MRAVCISEIYCPYKSDTGYCGYTGGCIKDAGRSIPVEIPKTPTYTTTMLVDISTESINKIAEAVVERLHEVAEALQDKPNGEGELVKRGRWIDPAAEDCYRCSVCEEYTQMEMPRLLYHYCPNCGALMEYEEGVKE